MPNDRAILDAYVGGELKRRATESDSPLPPAGKDSWT